MLILVLVLTGGPGVGPGVVLTDSTDIEPGLVLTDSTGAGPGWLYWRWSCCRP